MRPALADKVIVIWISAALAVWCCCLVVLWHVSLDASGQTTLIAIASTFLAVAFGISLPRLIVRSARRVGGWFGHPDPLGFLLPSMGPKRSRPGDVRGMMYLLAGASIFAAVCGLISLGAVIASERVADSLTRAMSLSPTEWLICKLVIQFVGMIPIAAGIALTFLVAGMVRAGSGRDIYASVFREWFGGVAIGLVVFGICWELGVNVRGLAGMMAVALFGAAGAIFQRQTVTRRPVRIQRPVETPSIAKRVGIALTFGAVLLAIVLQLRLWGDAVGIGLGGWACWAGISIAMLLGFLRRTDHKSHPPGVKQMIGAVVGVCASLLLQAAFLISAGRGEATGAICRTLAITLQIPIAAMAAVIISRQRRLFAYAGGRARQYIRSGAVGAGVAALGYLVLASTQVGAMIVLVAALGLCAGGVIAGTTSAKRIGEQLKWAASGVVLLCALAAAMLGALHSVGEDWTSVRPGVWLTAVGSAPAIGPSVSVTGMLPGPPIWRGKAIDETISRIIADHQGRWLAAVASKHDVPADLSPASHVTLCWPDPTALPTNGRSDRPTVGRGGDFFSTVRLGRERFDGVLLALISADHPQAWRCHNDQTIRRVLDHLQLDGVAVLRLQGGDAGLATALSAARAFRNAVGPCWATFQHRDGQVDLLLAGPTGLVRRPQAEGLIVVPDKQLWYEWSGSSPLRLEAGRDRQRNAPSVRQFVERLDALRTP